MWWHVASESAAFILSKLLFTLRENCFIVTLRKGVGAKVQMKPSPKQPGKELGPTQTHVNELGTELDFLVFAHIAYLASGQTQWYLGSQT